jgi:hypothetical protein
VNGEQMISGQENTPESMLAKDTVGFVYLQNQGSGLHLKFCGDDIPVVIVIFKHCSKRRLSGFVSVERWYWNLSVDALSLRSFFGHPAINISRYTHTVGHLVETLGNIHFKSADV